MSAIIKIKQLLIHIQSVSHILHDSDFTMFKLWDTDSFIKPADVFRKGNDILAATYCHLLPLANPHGYDAIALDGTGYELKLAYIDIDEYSVSSSNNLIRTCSKNTLEQTVAGHYKIFKTTDSANYTKDTILVLISKKHKSFISGFILPSNKIIGLLPDTEVIQKKIALAKFIELGKELNSAVRHIGYDNFIVQSKLYISGKISEEEYLNIRQASLDTYI